MTGPITNSRMEDDPFSRLPAAVDRQLDVLRSAAGDRFGQLELAVSVTIRITDQRRSSTEDLIAERGWSGIDVEQVWAMPTVYIGSVSQICHDLVARQDRFGLSYFLTSDRHLQTLADVLASS